jgi:hypothetical protein
MTGGEFRGKSAVSLAAGPCHGLLFDNRALAVWTAKSVRLEARALSLCAHGLPLKSSASPVIEGRPSW